MATNGTARTTTAATKSVRVPVPVPELPQEQQFTAQGQAAPLERVWEHYRQHRRQHWTDCTDYYCKSHNSSHETRNRYLPEQFAICSICGDWGHGRITCQLEEAIRALDRDKLKQQVTLALGVM